MVIKQNLMPSNRYSAKSPYTMTPRYITVHVGTDISAEDNISNMIHNPTRVSYHFAVDDKEAVQALPAHRNGWHCKDGVNGTGNRESIGIMICCSRSDATRFAQAQKNAAQLTAKLMHDHNIPLSNVCTIQHWNSKNSTAHIPNFGWKQFTNMVEMEHNAGYIPSEIYEYSPLAGTGIPYQDNYIQANRTSDSIQQEFVPGQVIIGMKSSYSRSTRTLSANMFPKLRVASAEILMHPQPPAAMRSDQNSAGDIVLLQLEEGTKRAVLDAISILEQDPDVDYAEPDYLQSADGWELNQTQFAPQINRNSVLWNLQMVKTPEAWTISTGSPEIKVGVMDSGIDYNHPNLAPNVDRSLGYDFYLDRNDISDQNGHGTFIAGLIGAVGNNNYNVKGISPNVSMVALKVINPETNRYPDSASIRAFEYANRHGIQVISRSISGTDYSRSLETAIRSYHGILLSSAGNNGNNTDVIPRYPVSLNIPNMITIGNSTQSDIRYFESNYGRTTVGLFAPGDNVVSTGIGGRFRTGTGTSYSTPLVAGAAALALAINPALSPEELKQLILETVDKTSAYTNICTSDGRLNAARLLEYVKNTLPTEPCIGAVEPPANIRLSNISQTSITVNWDLPNQTNGIQNYELYRNNTKIADIGANEPRSFVDNGLKPNTGYTYHMRSIAVSENSNTVYGTTIAEVVALQPPRNLRTSNVGTNEITIAWDLPITTSNVSGFYVYRNNSRIATLSPTATSYRNTGLSASTTYQYRVASYGTGNEASSGTINATTNQVVTPPPTNDTWSSTRVYNGGEEVIYQGLKYRAKYYSKGTPPDGQNANSAWKYIDINPLPWRNNIPYDANERVTYNGANYISRFWTAAGILPTVTSSWARN